MEKTAFNLKENTAGAICYIIPPISGLIMYIFEIRRGTKNTIVKFHALQSIIFLGGISLLQFILAFLPFTKLIRETIDLVFILIWAYLIYQAIKGRIFKVPIIGDVCWSFANKK